MYNKITLVGYTSKDADLRYTPSGTAVCETTIATNHSYKKDGEWQQETLFLSCTIFGAFAETMASRLTKGTMVFAEGRLQEQKWETEGEQRRRMVAILSIVRVLEKKEKEKVREEPQKQRPEDDLEPF